MAHDAIAHTEAARLAQQDAAELIHQILLLAFDNEKAVRDQSAKNHSHLLPAGMRGLREFPLELFERKGFEVVELLEDFRNRGRSIWIYAQLFPLVVRSAGRFLGPGSERPCQRPKQQGTYSNSDGEA